jgi:(R,R)-butanediol dehydrogenase/meso-butanediol dehydrogenase/diacetyl reductase
MRAASYQGPRVVALRDVPRPQPGPGEVLVRVRACGICGSDLHRYRGGGLGSGAVPGHEIAGEVAALGPGVSGWEIGAPVAVEPLVTCRACTLCTRGDYQLCRRRLLLGVGRDGGLAEYVAVPVYTLFPLPADLPFPVAALAEPTAVAVHAVRLLGVQPGERVLVQGSGSIGLLTALAARAAGAQVVATARYPHQAAAAHRFGVTRVFPADGPGARELADFAAAEPFDAVIETVGGEADTLVQAPTLVRPGGRVCVVGIFFQPPRLNAFATVLNEVRLVGAATYGRAAGVADFERAIALVAAHRDLVSGLITHRFPLAEIARAYATADDKASHALKVTVEP